uniref:Uncharacterized protein n=1 Tax=Rhizophora mucronata TaxID=61149 RepID=A0A2P2PFE9_RHIMU
MIICTSLFFCLILNIMECVCFLQMVSGFKRLTESSF